VTLLTEPEPDSKEELWQKTKYQIKNFTFLAPAKNNFGDESNIGANEIYKADWDDPAFAKAHELISQKHPWPKDPVSLYQLPMNLCLANAKKSDDAQILSYHLNELRVNAKQWFSSIDRPASGLGITVVSEHLSGTSTDAQETRAPSTDDEKTWLEDHEFAHLSWVIRSRDWTTCEKLYEANMHGDIVQFVDYIGKGHAYAHGFGYVLFLMNVL
jgi:hypothetical protein